MLGDISANLPGRFQVVFFLVSLISHRAAVDHAVALRDDVETCAGAAAARCAGCSLGDEDDLPAPRRSAVPALTANHAGGAPAPRRRGVGTLVSPALDAPCGALDILLHPRRGADVAGAYCFFFALILLYLAIMSGRLSRTEREPRAS